MITIKKVDESSTEVLALLGVITYTESHGQFIENQSDLIKYNKAAFSVAKTKKDLNDPNNLFYIIYEDDLPIGYAKLVLGVANEFVISKNSCMLERIYILNDFIPLKIGQPFLSFLEEEVKSLQLDTMWLSVYVENFRAIRFYERNNFKNVGTSIFQVNGKGYENFIFSKSI